MKIALAVVLVAGLFCAVSARADQAAATPGTAAPVSGPVAGTQAPAPPVAQNPIPLFACVPTCDYYQSYCTTICSGRGGVKSFGCTPTFSPHCASFTCTCNLGFGL